MVRRFLARELGTLPRGHTVTILDIGSGDCDIPLAVRRWADRRGHQVRFTCLDHDAQAVALARQQIARCGGGTVEAIQTDVFTYQPTGTFDYAVGSMTFHHFTDDEIDRLIRHLRGFVRRALLINDLDRCLLNYLACFLLALPVDWAIRHDGLLSTRRGFRPPELARFLAKQDPMAVVRRQWFRRVAAVVRFDRRCIFSLTCDPSVDRGRLACPWVLGRSFASQKGTTNLSRYEGRV
ncbi:MAG: methyltransferase domain-containing protein [Planctomycetes bacterium]|nr:methyltransferase domain-containing protein [Planctomycetota bacterium]